jgi:Cys-tRNA(Pro) deacylase
MSESKHPVTSAIRVLRAKKVPYEGFLYAYEERGGTRASSLALGVSEHLVIKTLILEDEAKKPLIALMHGDQEVSTKNLARLLGVKTIAPCSVETANRHSGYEVGGTSPFGTKRAMPVFMQKTISELPSIYINGGKRGFLVRISPLDAARVLDATLAEIAAG